MRPQIIIIFLISMSLCGKIDTPWKRIDYDEEDGSVNSRLWHLARSASIDYESKELKTSNDYTKEASILPISSYQRRYKGYNLYKFIDTYKFGDDIIPGLFEVTMKVDPDETDYELAVDLKKITVLRPISVYDLTNENDYIVVEQIERQIVELLKNKASKVEFKATIVEEYDIHNHSYYLVASKVKLTFANGGASQTIHAIFVDSPDGHEVELQDILDYRKGINSD
jgi:hypothetical protein